MVSLHVCARVTGEFYVKSNGNNKKIISFQFSVYINDIDLKFHNAKERLVKVWSKIVMRNLFHGQFFPLFLE